MSTLRFITRDGKKILQERTLEGQMVEPQWKDVPCVTEPEQRKPREYWLEMLGMGEAIVHTELPPYKAPEQITHVIEKLSGSVMVQKEVLLKYTRAIDAMWSEGQPIRDAIVKHFGTTHPATILKALEDA